MIGLSTSLNARKRKTAPVGVWFCALVFSMILAIPSGAFASDAGDDLPASANSGASWIQITGHSFQGDRLIINYVIQYPGMTKVKLFDGSNQMLWRGQYVNDEEGDHRIVLKANLLQPGSYVFEFDYKDQKLSYPVSF